MSTPAQQPNVQSLVAIYQAMRELLETIAGERGSLVLQAELIDREVYVAIDAALADASDELADVNHRLLRSLRAIGVARALSASIDHRLKTPK